MRVFLTLAFLVSFYSSAAEVAEWRGIYEGIKQFRNQEIQGMSYQYLDLKSSEGVYIYDSNVLDKDQGIRCRVNTKGITWNAPLAKIPLDRCNSDQFEFELIVILDVSFQTKSNYPLKSDALVSLISHSKGFSLEVVTMWLLRTENNLLLKQLEQTVPYGK